MWCWLGGGNWRPMVWDYTFRVQDARAFLRCARGPESLVAVDCGGTLGARLVSEVAVCRRS